MVGACLPGWACAVDLGSREHSPPGALKPGPSRWVQVHAIAGAEGQTFGRLHVSAGHAPDLAVVETIVDLCALAIDADQVRTRLEQANARYDAALSNLSQGVCFFDGEQRLIVANRRYADLYNIPPGALVPGLKLSDIVEMRVAAGSGPTMAAQTYLNWRGAVQQVDGASSTVVELANGRVMSIHHQPMPDSGWVATHEDITERRRAEAQVAHMARHDLLTGLANRLQFNEQLDQVLQLTALGGCAALLCIDLDRFKAVNDTFGHAVGDSLLRNVAERLRACARSTDVVTRLGGDEFAILLANTSSTAIIAEIASRLTQVLAEPFIIDEHRVSIGASVGIARAPVDAQSAEDLLRAADMALYRSKYGDRGGFCFFETAMRQTQDARQALEDDLRRAIENQALTLAYQPVINIATNEPCAFEALLRWTHPHLGQIAPDTIIPIAESARLMRTLGAWVVRAACAEAANWPAPTRVCVNVSPLQLTDTDFLGIVETALLDAGLPAHRLELEITERVSLDDGGHGPAVLHALRSLGVKIALDNFGVGASSMTYVRQFPFDRIKIDRSVTADLPGRPAAQAMMRSIAEFAGGLGMLCTCEGIETAEQLAHARLVGCTDVQGELLHPAQTRAAARRIAWGIQATREPLSAG